MENPVTGHRGGHFIVLGFSCGYNATFHRAQQYDTAGICYLCWKGQLPDRHFILLEISSKYNFLRSYMFLEKLGNNQ